MTAAIYGFFPHMLCLHHMFVNSTHANANHCHHRTHDFSLSPCQPAFPVLSLHGTPGPLLHVPISVRRFVTVPFGSRSVANTPALETSPSQCISCADETQAPVRKHRETLAWPLGDVDMQFEAHGCACDVWRAGAFVREYE